MSKYRILPAVCLPLIGFAVSLLNGCTSAMASHPTHQFHVPQERGADLLTHYLYSVLNSVRISGRIYFSGFCEEGTLLFPAVNMRPPPEGKSGLPAVRDIFAKANNVLVTADQPSMVRVVIGEAPRLLLRTKIGYLAFTALEQYNYNAAIRAIEQSPEVKAAMQTYGFRLQAVPINEVQVQPRPGLPHLPAHLTNVTMDQSLDEVAKVFNGLIFYGVCDQSLLYEIEFTGGVYFDDRSGGQ